MLQLWGIVLLLSSSEFSKSFIAVFDVSYINCAGQSFTVWSTCRLGFKKKTVSFIWDVFQPSKGLFGLFSEKTCALKIKTEMQKIVEWKFSELSESKIENIQMVFLFVLPKCSFGGRLGGMESF